MNQRIPFLRRAILLTGALLSFGCAHAPKIVETPAIRPPHEGGVVTLTAYVVNPPDILYIEMEALPSDNHVIQPTDLLTISVGGTIPDHPISDNYLVSSDGMISLGTYGAVKVGGMTITKAKEAIAEHLKKDLAEPVVSMQIAGIRPISGEYLVRPDGNVKLGFYGAVYVAGQPLHIIEESIKAHLETNHGLVNPKVSVDVAAYNSMVYYIVSDGGGFGDQVTTLAWTGHETVLDAVGELGGLPQTGSKKNIWISRPVAGQPDTAQILPVDWKGITMRGATSTNYQIQPGDRLFVKADKLVATDNAIAKFLAPMERLLGTTTLWQIVLGTGGASNNTGGNGGGF